MPAIPRDLRSYSGLFQGHTELRVQENRILDISVTNGNLTRNERSSTRGVSARVCRNGSWGFCSRPELSPDVVESVIAQAADNAAFLDSRARQSPIPVPSAAGSSENDFSTRKPRLDQPQLVGFVRELDAHIQSRYPALTSRDVTLHCLDTEKSLLTSDGSSSYAMTPRAVFTIVLATEKDGRPVELFDVAGGFGQFEDRFAAPTDLFAQIDEQHEHLMDKRDGVHARAGVAECILSTSLTGMLAHEAMGHTTEADFVLAGSVAADHLDAAVASPLVTLVDFAHTALGATCPVPVFIDDEGTPATDAVIIQDGVLKGYMHSRETAARFGVPPTGNSRAAQFSDEPLIRMRNTAILPGQSTLDDMIASVDDGYYLMRSGNGGADATGEFNFGISLGYEISNGKLGTAIRDTTASGMALDVLQSVSMVSDDMVWAEEGICGKLQNLPTSEGGAAIKCRLSIGGE